MLAVALLLGAVIGLLLGALGGGGSILTVPALVYVLDRPADQATAASLVIVGITSLTSAISHARARHVRWASGIVFGLAGLPTSFAGTWANRAVNPDALLLAFAALMLLAAGMMIRRTRTADREPADRSSHEVVNDASVPLNASRWDRSTVVKIVTAGLAIGFLTGFFGVGGGFLIVPALTLVLGYTMPQAVGTSLLIIAIDSSASLLARSGIHQSFDWRIIIPFTLAAMAGSLLGKRISDRLPEGKLTRAFAGLLMATAVYVAVRSISGLT